MRLSQGSISSLPAPFPGKPFPCCTCSWSSDTCSRLRWRSAPSSRPTCGCSRSSPRTRSGSRPPNPFVARIVMLALLLLYVTGGAIVVQGLGERPDYLDNPKLQAKIGLVVLLTLNAFVLHHVTFPRLARGRRVPRWNHDRLDRRRRAGRDLELPLDVLRLPRHRPGRGTTPRRCATSSRSPRRSTSSSSSACSRSWPWPAATSSPTTAAGPIGWPARSRRSAASAAPSRSTRRRRSSSRHRAAARRPPMPRAPAPPRCRRPPSQRSGGRRVPALRLVGNRSASALGALAASPAARGEPRPANHRLEQVIDHRLRLRGPAGVHRRGLDDGTARRHQPVKALARR